MPHYEFICKECKEEFEQVLHIDDLESKLVKCPKCGSDKVEQQVAAFFANTAKKS